MAVDRASLEAVIQRALAHVAANSAYGSLTVVTINRARRDILAAADAYRAWMPDADPPTPTQRVLAAGRRSELRLALIHSRTDRRDTERPTP
jgi:hypothetical protein